MSENVKRLYRSRDDRMLAGVCGGIAEYFGVDSTLIRLALALGVFLSVSGLLWVYLILALLVPLEPETAPGVVDVVPPAA